MVNIVLHIFKAYSINSGLILYGPLRCDGFGLSDGEVMERLWSYLRRFTRMTKEMCPSHCTDVLAHALLYYGYMTKKKLGVLVLYDVIHYYQVPYICIASLLLQRWNKANEMKCVAIQQFTSLIAHVQGDLLIVHTIIHSIDGYLNTMTTCTSMIMINLNSFIIATE